MLKKHKADIIAVGVDEAGRGALAGPVVAAAVYIERHYAFLKEVRDSKKIKSADRDVLYDKILQSEKIHHGIGTASVEEIDEINILQATYLAMSRAIDALDITPEHLYIDGNRYNGYENIPHSCIIGGDDIYLSIAAASILAKVYRDRLMIDAANLYPEYDLAVHKGYGTAKHRAAIQKYGRSEFHRKSFKLKD